MAILVATTSPPPPDTGDVTGTRRPVQVGPRLTWTSAAGRVTSLEDFGDFRSGMITLPGVLGLGMPTYAFYEDASPVSDGAIVRGTPRANPRDITVPVHIWAATRSECLRRWRSWVSDLNPQLGPGKLTLFERDGTSRQISAYYSQGLEGTADDDGTGPTWFTCAAVFHASRPFWLGDVRERTFQIGAGGGAFFPFLPLVVADSSPGGAVQLVNQGDADCYPVWTITGPCSSLTLTNVTSGKSLHIDYALALGDTLVVDTTDGAKYVQLNSSTNLWPAVDIAAGSSLWPLLGGINDLVLAAPAAGPTTSIAVRFQERYLTAT